MLFNHRGVLVELYCRCAYWFWSRGGWFPLWKNSLLVGGQKLLNPPGVFLCITLINCCDLVTLIALSFTEVHIQFAPCPLAFYNQPVPRFLAPSGYLSFAGTRGSAGPLIVLRCPLVQAYYSTIRGR